MPGEIERFNPLDMVSLRDYFDTLFLAYQQSHQEQHRLIDAAITRARDVVDARFEGTNEWRAQLQEERAEYVRRREIDLLLAPLFRRLEQDEGRTASLEKTRDGLEGRLAVIVVVIATILVVLEIGMRFILR